MIMAILRAYSAIFRYTGLIMALLSLLASAAIGIGIVRDGYILVNGHPSRDFASIATAVGTPLLGLAIGLALFSSHRKYVHWMARTTKRPDRIDSKADTDRRFMIASTRTLRTYPWR